MDLGQWLYNVCEEEIGFFDPEKKLFRLEVEGPKAVDVRWSNDDSLQYEVKVVCPQCGVENQMYLQIDST